MKIQDPNLAGQRPLEHVGQTKAEGAANTPAKTTEAGRTSSADQVQLSNLAEHLSVEDPHSAEREARIARLAQEVAAGRYNPDPVQIAKGLVKEAAAGE